MDTSRFKFLGKRLPLTLVVLLLVMALAAAALYYYLLDPNRYIPRVQALAQDATGLPVTIEGIHWAFNPAPVMVFTNVRVGDEEFGARAVNVRAQVDMFTLIQGRANIPQVWLSGVELFIPQGFGDTAKRFMEVVRHGRTSEVEKKEDQGAEVGTITIDAMRVFRGGEPWARTDATIAGVTAPNIAIDATLNARGPEAEGGVLTTSLRFDKSDNAISGKVTLQGPALALLPELGKQDLAVDLAAKIEGTTKTQIAGEVTGSFTSAAFEQQGTMHALAFWKQGLFIVNDLQAISQDGKVHLDTTVTPGKEAAFEIYEATIGHDTLALAAAALMPDVLDVELAEDASVVVSDVLGAYPLGEQERPRFARGTAAFTGITLSPGEGGAWPPLRNLTGRASMTGDRVLIEDFSAEGLHLTGEAGPGEDGKLAANLSGTVDLVAIALHDIEALKAVQSMEGKVVVESLYLASPAAEREELRIGFAGRAENAGLTIALPNVDKPMTAKGITGGITYDGDTLALNQIKGDGFAVDGSINLDGDMDRSFTFTGESELSHPLVRLALANAPLRDLGGRVELARLEGVLPKGEDAPRDLVVQGAIKEASFSMKMGDDTLTASKVNGDFSTAEKQVDAKLSMQTDPLGALRWDGKLHTEELTVNGVLRLNLARAVAALAPAARANETMRQAIESYGEASLSLEARLPKGDRAPHLQFTSKEEPPLEATLGFEAAKGGGWALDEVKLDTTLPLKGLDFPGSLPVHASGSAKVALRREADAESYTATIGLDSADIKVGDYLHKQPGQALQATLTGAAGNWKARSLEVQLLDQNLNLKVEDGGIAGEDVSLNLAALSPLFPQDVTTRGTVQATFDTSPVTVDAQLRDVALALSPTVRVDTINGGIGYTGGVWSFHELRVVGADSDFILDAGLRDGRWTGGLSGARLNLNAITEMQKAYAGENGKIAEGPTDKQADTAGLHGEMQLQLGQVFYQRAQLDNVSGQLVLTPGQYDLSSFQAYLGPGVLQGRIVYKPQKGDAAGNADIDLSMRTVDAAVLDGLLFPNPRGMTGAVDADIDLNVPIETGVPPYMGLTGRVEYSAKDGTYGSAGGADRLLAVLRATEILRLTIPGLGEESGLAYNRTNATVIAQRGVLAIEDFNLQSRAYAFLAAGTIDFPNDTTDIEGRMDIMESVTSLVDIVPIVGGAVGGLKGGVAIGFSVTGSPFDIQVSARPGLNPFENTKEGIKGVLEDVTNVKGLFGLRKNKR